MPVHIEQVLRVVRVMLRGSRVVVRQVALVLGQNLVGVVFGNGSVRLGFLYFLLAQARATVRGFFQVM
jgi:hypothetical protein